MSNIQSFFQTSDLFFQINTNKENLDLKTEIGDTLYNSSHTKRVIIPSSVTLGGTTTANAALSIPSGAGGRILVDNYGSIQGAGGAAGGGTGGDAILARSTCTIENKSSGTIYAGGGGGGAGGGGGTGGQGSYQYVTGSYENCYQYYYWGGCAASWTGYNYATAYSNGGSGGNGGTGGAGRGYNQSIGSGTAGTAGGGGSNNSGPGGTGGAGGSGGDWGQSGSTGVTGSTGANGNYTNGLSGSPGVLGGSSGYYINGLGTYATLVNSGTVAGLGTEPQYVNITFTASGNLTLTGNGSSAVNIFKTSGSSSWDNQAYSTNGFTAPCTIEFNKEAASTDNSASYAMIGWNEDPTTNASYDTIDHASYPYQTNAYQVYNNGSVINPGVGWNTANKFYVVYGTDGLIRHYNGSTLLYTSSSYGAGKTVYVDSSYYSPNSTYGGFSNIRVVRAAWNGSSYVT